MDLRSYYRKVRDEEAHLTSDYVVVVSLPTSEGGKEGVKTEVPRNIAARLIAEGRARAGTSGETLELHEANREALVRHQNEEAARKVQVMVIPQHQLQKTRERN